MWQRFSENARKAVFYAQEEAQKTGEFYVSTEHILLGLLWENGTIASKALSAMGVPLKEFRDAVAKTLPATKKRHVSDMSLTPRAKRVIDLAYDEARILGNNYIGSEHLLLGVIREGDADLGRVLEKFGIELEKTRREVTSQQGRDPETVSPLASNVRAAWGAPMTKFMSSVLEYARWEAEMFDGANSIETVHVLLGLLRLEECLGTRLLVQCGVDLPELREELDGSRCRRERGPKVYLHFDSEVELFLESAKKRAAADGYVGTEHIVLEILTSEACKWGRVLRDKYGVSAEYYERVAKLFYDEDPGPGGG